MVGYKMNMFNLNKGATEVLLKILVKLFGIDCKVKEKKPKKQKKDQNVKTG